jgi:cytochrome b
VTGLSTGSEKTARRLLVWDWPTRVVHWAFVILMVFAWGTATYNHMDWHRYCGYALLSLLVFRLYWGVAGSTPSRFASFVRGPKTVLQYLRALPDRTTPITPGHNPLGALSVIAVLALLLVEVVLGLFAVDVDGIESGPLSAWVSFDAGRVSAHWHHLLFNGLLGLIALHLIAIAFYALYKRENLIGPMLHGRKNLPPREDFAGALWPRIAVGAILALVATVMVARAFKL